MGSVSICMRCMEGNIVNGRCTHCGNEPNDNRPPFALPVGWNLKDGRYYIGEVLGCGGFGITYAAWDRGQRKRVAIKEYYPKIFAARKSTGHILTPISGKAGEYDHSRKRFLQEAQMLHSMQNIPNILQVYDFFDEMGTSYYSMEYLEGRTFQQLVKDSGPISWSRLEAPTVGILKALEQMHALGLFHRDISPDNIILLYDNSARLIDFGSARNYKHSDHFTVSVKDQFSPWEMWQSNGSQGPWTDIFSLGATLYFCLTGLLPENSIQRLSSVRQNGTDPLESIARQSLPVPDNVQSAIVRAMSLKVSDRYQSANEFMSALFPTAEQLSGRKLICLSGIMAGTSYQLRFGSVLTMGRDSVSAVKYPETARFISRHHCSIRLDQRGEIYLRDDGSSNGTFLNGKRLPPNQWVCLIPGDRFKIADEIYTIQYDRISYRVK